MFNHQWIETYHFEDIPLDRDIFLMEERWLPEYEAVMAFLRKETKEFNVGEVAFATARGLQGDSIQMSWYPNAFDRFHEVPFRLPRSAFVTAVGAWHIDEKPHVFVKDVWLNELYRRAYAVFVMIDAIGVKERDLCRSADHRQADRVADRRRPTGGPASRHGLRVVR